MLLRTEIDPSAGFGFVDGDGGRLLRQAGVVVVVVMVSVNLIKIVAGPGLKARPGIASTVTSISVWLPVHIGCCAVDSTEPVPMFSSRPEG